MRQAKAKRGDSFNLPVDNLFILISIFTLSTHLGLIFAFEMKVLQMLNGNMAGLDDPLHHCKNIFCQSYLKKNMMFYTYVSAGALL